MDVRTAIVIEIIGCDPAWKTPIDLFIFFYYLVLSCDGRNLGASFQSVK
jgi:hypothetical protein